MTTRPITLATLALFAVACVDQTTTGPAAANTAASTRPTIAGPMAGAGNNGNGVVHRVSVGGHDFSDPGVDKNFSLIALEHGDGTVTGQWIDMFGKDPDGNPVGGIHVDVDCVSVLGNQAWISGTIKNGTAFGVDVTGQRALTRVVDNGKSANDPPDQISFSFFPIRANVTCALRPNVQLFAMPDGQVTVD